MGEMTGIAWTDSTMNWWRGCTKVGPGCDNCYAADRDVRYEGGSHWGAGAPRIRAVEHTRNALARYQKASPKFVAKHGHRQRVFCSSLSDIFDNEVPDEWRAEAFADMEAAPDVLVQICTKRVSNIAKMIPEHWRMNGGWPANVGVLITVVTPEEVERDVPRLVHLKKLYGIPWVGLSIEPMVSDVSGALLGLGQYLNHVDWVIFGGESGRNARPLELGWISRGITVCDEAGVAVFVKQLGTKPMIAGEPLHLQDAAGSDTTEWPAHWSTLQTRRFPAALDG